MRAETITKIANFVELFAGAHMTHFTNPRGAEFPSWTTLKKYGVVVATGREVTVMREVFNGEHDITVPEYKVVVVKF